MNMKTLMVAAALAAMGSAQAGVVGEAIRPYADNGQLPGAISILYNNGVEEIDYETEWIDDDALFEAEYEAACEFEWECRTGR